MARSNDENFVDFEAFEVSMKNEKNKKLNENHEKIIVLGILRFNGGHHSNPQVK